MKVIYSVLGTLCVVAGLTGIYAATKYSRLTEIKFDEPTQWARQFTASTGIPFLKVTRMAGNRERVDHLAIVGKDRPLSWFEEQGFECLGNGELEEISPADSFTGILDGEEKRAGYVLTHRVAAPAFFIYLPDVGVLICPGGLVPSYDD
jgi:hypothetical protein